MYSSSFVQLITKPSRISDSNMSFALIDNIFVNEPTNYTSGLILSSISDHYPVFVVFHDFFSQLDNNANCKTISFRVLDDINIRKLYDSIESLDFTDVISVDDVSVGMAMLDSIVMGYYNECCPVKTKTISYKDSLKPWIDQVVKGEIRKRDAYLRLLRADKISKELYNNYRNRVTKLIRERRRVYLEKKFNELKFDIKRTWSLINNVLKPSLSSKQENVKELSCHGTV